VVSKKLVVQMAVVQSQIGFAANMAASVLQQDANVQSVTQIALGNKTYAQMDKSVVLVNV
jgi:hypothetical protein